MATKVLTIAPLLALAGLFLAAGIVQAGVIFLLFAAAMLWAFLRRPGSRIEPRDSEEI